MSKESSAHFEALLEQAQEDAYRVVQAPRRSYTEKMRDLMREKEEQEREAN